MMKPVLLLLVVFVGTCEAWLFIPSKKCYDIYGTEECFSTEKPYGNTANKPPESPSHQQVAFLLYTPANRKTPDTLCGNDPTCLTSSHFNKTKKIRVIIHGFTDKAAAPWVQEMIQELLSQDGSNVIAVDWEKGADNLLINYLQSAANTRVVGALAAKVIEQIVTAYPSVTYDSFHLIGHSLGAQISGEIGRRLGGKIGRITGLDPAGPAFENEEVAVRLDSTDAQFVDAIHTDGKKLIQGGFGTLVEMGDADFYPNGGRNQPGCGAKGITERIVCSHSRVTDLFTESINSACSFTAVSCSSIDDITSKKCPSTGTTARMGFHAESSARGKFYLATNDKPPYCKA